MTGLLLTMTAALAHEPVDFVTCVGDEAVWVASLDDGALVDRTAQPRDEADVVAVWSGGRLVSAGVDQATVAWPGCTVGPRQALPRPAEGAVERRLALGLLAEQSAVVDDLVVRHPVGAGPVVEVVARQGEHAVWTLRDGAGRVVLAPTAVEAAPQWHEVEAGEPGRWVGWAPTERGLVVVHLGDGEVEVVEAEAPGAGRLSMRW